MCSCSAKPDLDTGKEYVNARNPANPEPCVAKWITLADLNRYNTLCLVACSLSTGMVPSMLATEIASFSAYGSQPKFHCVESNTNGGTVGLPTIRKSLLSPGISTTGLLVTLITRRDKNDGTILI